MKNKEAAESVESVQNAASVVNEQNEEEEKAKIRIQKLEQLRKRLEDEAQELSRNTKLLADQMLQDANKEARKIIEDSHNQAATAYEERLKEAKQEGKRQAIEQYDSLLKEARDIIQEANDYRDSVFKNNEREIVELILKCVEKIIKEKLDEGDEVVSNVIMSSIADIHSKSSLLIKISSEDFDTTKLLRDKILAMFPGVVDIQFKIVEGYQKGDMEIDSEEGTVNPSIKQQIVKLRDEFTKLIEDE